MRGRGNTGHPWPFCISAYVSYVTRVVETSYWLDNILGPLCWYIVCYVCLGDWAIDIVLINRLSYSVLTRSVCLFIITAFVSSDWRFTAASVPTSSGSVTSSVSILYYYLPLISNWLHSHVAVSEVSSFLVQYDDDDYSCEFVSSVWSSKAVNVIFQAVWCLTHWIGWMSSWPQYWALSHATVLPWLGLTIHASHHDRSVMGHASAIQKSADISHCYLPGCQHRRWSDCHNSHDSCFIGLAFLLVDDELRLICKHQRYSIIPTTTPLSALLTLREARMIYFWLWWFGFSPLCGKSSHCVSQFGLLLNASVSCSDHWQDGLVPGTVSRC